MIKPPLFSDIVDAASHLAGNAVHTPLLDCPAASRLCGGRVLIKPEMLQRTGSFKFRGAYNLISRLSPDQQSRGIVAYSSGNHAQAVAAVAQQLHIPATIVMPADAPQLKLTATRDYGAEIVLYDRFGESREDIAARLVAESGATLVPPFDHPLIIAGQGTVGLEIAEDLAARDLMPDVVVVPCGGGGLISGTSIALKQAHAGISIYAAEPAGFDDTTRSLKSGNRETVADSARSICDALLSPTPGEITFAINRENLAGGVVVTDDQAKQAMAFAYRHLKLVVEPGGAVALAAVLNGLVDCRDKTVITVCSGGNVDPEMFQEALAGAAA
ncbi:MAG: threonine/serine dehydratase [Rhodospirillaceae bacterium]|jgi:threonine dehydratase|nr:threonine/serine dehydratase [Rhodospirillaceae bacterium]